MEEVTELAERELQEKGSVLIVVNTKQSARVLYQAIAAKQLPDVNLYHLSTNMCAAHRLNVLEEINSKLNQKEPVICVSTQLIEAGVDMDFGSVIRYLAGLDSIAQAAGRCNRHGTRQGLGNVWIVNPAEENVENLPDIKIGISVAQRVLDDFQADPSAFGNSRIGVEAMAAYYRFYYHERKKEMEYPITEKSSAERDDSLFNLLSLNTLSKSAYCRKYDANPDLVFLRSFQTAAKEFQVIDSATRGVIVPYAEEGKAIIAELCSNPELARQFRLLRRAQRFAVNMFPHEFQKLANLNTIHEVQPGAGIFYLDERYYSNKLGWSDEFASSMSFLVA